MVISSPAGRTWYIDRDSENRWICHKVKKKILTRKTKYQEVEIIDTVHLGRIVLLDKKIQSAERDEFIYHEALVHPSMISHPDPRRVIILGGGEGATLREVLKHPSVCRVVMIDIDEEFVNTCRRYLKKWHRKSFEDSRVELIFADAFNYLKKTDEKADVIIADISDPADKGPARLMYTGTFYSLIKNALNRDGIFVTHATDVYKSSQKNISLKILRTLRGIFPKTSYYYEYIPSYGSQWSFVTGSFKYSPDGMSASLVEKRLQQRKLENLLYYSPETHNRLFCLPKHIRNII